MIKGITKLRVWIVTIGRVIGGRKRTKDMQRQHQDRDDQQENDHTGSNECRPFLFGRHVFRHTMFSSIPFVHTMRGTVQQNP
jgi:hypothetical protein